MDNQNVTVKSQNTFPIFGIVFLILFAGKVFEVTPAMAALSWWWVTAPLWFPLGLAVGLFLLAMLILAITR